MTLRDALADLLRNVLSGYKRPRRRTFIIKPTHMGHKAGLTYDSVESLIEYGEGERHR